MLQAKNVTLKRNHTTLLNNISVSLNHQEFVAVLGPNGAGKSTLLRVMSDEWQGCKGDVYLAQQPMRAITMQQRAQKMAVLPQHSELNFTFNVLDLVMLGRLPHNTTQEQDLAVASECLHHVDASHLANRDYLTLSGGEKQRVQLARIFAQIVDTQQQRHRYLLLDEPASGLDIEHQHSIFRYIKKLTTLNIGALVIMHDLNLAAQYADRIILLNDGKIAYQGSPAQVLSADIIKHIFNVDVTVMPHPQDINRLLIVS